MNYLIPSLARLLAPISANFHPEVFLKFCQMTSAFIVCLGRRTISRVWETTGQSESLDHSSSFRLFSQAKWEWDDIIRSHLDDIIMEYIPGMHIRLVIDDTICHKRGAKVFAGGMFLDASRSTKKHKTLTFGNNWVMLGLLIELPFRKDRTFTIPLMWRLFEKQGTKTKKEHVTKTMLAAEMIKIIASWLPNFDILVAADSAYMVTGLLQNRPSNVDFLGPVCPTAVLHENGSKSFARNSESRLPTPKKMLEETEDNQFKKTHFKFTNGKKKCLNAFRFDAIWNTVVGSDPIGILLLRDPKGEWRNEALMCTKTNLGSWEMLIGYCMRWSIEVAFEETKGLLGFEDACVWKKESVERAAPMAWYSVLIVIMWYTKEGTQNRAAKRHRPWYRKEIITFSDMLSCMRLSMWEDWMYKKGDKGPPKTEEMDWILEYIATAA